MPIVIDNPDVGLLTEHDIHLFKEGSHTQLYHKLGAHCVSFNGQDGVLFSVWAPNASKVSVIGGFNGWDPDVHVLRPRWDGSGIWHLFVPGLAQGECYKYRVESNYQNYRADKGDPFATRWEMPPATSSMVWDLSYEWHDQVWMQERHEKNSGQTPLAIYEVHLGSWRRVLEDNNRSLSYVELAQQLTDYVLEMGYTHVEFMPVMEHPFFGSWGYQTTGFFAPSSRYGTPQDFMYLIDTLHQHGIGVILDWVPSHFPGDVHGLAYFDGTHLFEHADPRQGFHPEWNSYIFNYGRNEVRSFLLSSALFWLDKYHADGLRVDAVASMLYLDYARREGEWIPNQYGGRENLDAIAFLRKLNESAYSSFADIQTIAEESTSWPMVSRPTYAGGLGFGAKWNMGWMHDTLDYFSNDPIYRRYYQDKLTFSIWYAFSENFVLPLSHDEVVYGKGSLLRKMPGDDWQRFANLRLLFGYMYGHPGKKLMFMGGEFGQWDEWAHDRSLDWHLLNYDRHQGAQRWTQDLNNLYRQQRALFEQDFLPDGFEWIDFNDRDQSIISFLRKGREPREIILVVYNFAPVPRMNYGLGVPQGGDWKVLLNSDAAVYGGSDYGQIERVEAAPLPAHGRLHSVYLDLPPLAVMFLKPASAV
ncbi:MAG TPA: 1,4-alpha-glucan branching protein GlgB [Gammaproteobacteria bacterium]|nr:1,4-alpha-glucan branching protein GlgB [Gammaproteobacteria bacterium]